MNDPQLECYHVAAHTSVFVAGRRLGKTHGVVAPWMLRNTQHMPGSALGVVCATFQQALTRTLPGTLAALEDMGYRRDLHYYVGVRPPKSAGFAKPVREPISYDRVVAWYDGTVWYLISQDVPGSANSLTLQGVMGDEAKFLNFEKLKDEVFPANGGFRGPWADCPWLNSMLFVSDMPTSKKGSWFLNYEDQATPEVIEAIKMCLAEIWKLSNQPQNTYAGKMLAYYRKTLAALRSAAVYYRECSTIENVLLLGEKYIRQMKRDLPPMVFLSSILCIKPGRLKDGFYPSLTDSLLYTAYDNAYLELIGYDFRRAQSEDCRQDGDLQPGKPICIAFDYNANINWMVCGQPSNKDNGMLTLKSFYVKYDRKLRELVDDFCEYYKYHNRREVVYYFDSTAIGSNYAVDKKDFAATICDQFAANGWRVDRKYIGVPMRHSDKYHMIYEAMRGQDGYLRPRFNQHNNEALLIAMRSSGVRIGPNGFEKDKRGEKYAETEEDRMEYRTDGTDAWDTLFIGMNKFPYAASSNFGGVAIRDIR